MECSGYLCHYQLTTTYATPWSKSGTISALSRKYLLVLIESEIIRQTIKYSPLTPYCQLDLDMVQCYSWISRTTINRVQTSRPLILYLWTP
jgi:hypothetical protein